MTAVLTPIVTVEKKIFWLFPGRAAPAWPDAGHPTDFLLVQVHMRHVVGDYCSLHRHRMPEHRSPYELQRHPESGAPFVPHACLPAQASVPTNWPPLHRFVTRRNSRATWATAAKPLRRCDFQRRPASPQPRLHHPHERPPPPRAVCATLAEQVHPRSDCGDNRVPTLSHRSGSSSGSGRRGLTLTLTLTLPAERL